MSETETVGASPMTNAVDEAINTCAEGIFEIFFGTGAHEPGTHDERVKAKLRTLVAALSPTLPVEPSEAIMAGIRWIAEDNGMPMNPGLTVPPGWEGVFALATKEAEALSAEELQVAIWGSDEDGNELAPQFMSRINTFNWLMGVIFDGELSAWAFGEGLGYPTPPAGFTLSTEASAMVSAGFAQTIDARPTPPVGVKALSKALTDIAVERARQQAVEGWDHEHDDSYQEGQLPSAAACYAWFAALPKQFREDVGASFPVFGDGELLRAVWPWEADWWKPKTPRKDLVRAGALIAAEIERLDRASKCLEEE